jgi:hypothetical protein
LVPQPLQHNPIADGFAKGLKQIGIIDDPGLSIRATPPFISPPKKPFAPLSQLRVLNSNLAWKPAGEQWQ